MKKVSKEKILNFIKKRESEDFSNIKLFEKILIKKRGFVFKMPNKGSNVILMASGGLDSMVVWGILMKEFGLNVYPITFNRGDKRRKQELNALKFFDKFYKKKFPKNYRKFLNFNLNQEELSIKIEKGASQLDEENILELLFKKSTYPAHLGTFTILPLLSRSYAMNLNLIKNLKINTIFSAVTVEDGEYTAHQTLTCFRSIMLDMCVAINDYSWQFVSACLEPESGFFLKRSDLIAWAHKNKIPIEKTWTCYHSYKYQCGDECLACISRKKGFVEAGVLDKTQYRKKKKSTIKNTMVLFLKSFIKKLVGYRR